MTPGGSNFNDFPENQLTKVRAVETVLKDLGFFRGGEFGNPSKRSSEH